MKAKMRLKKEIQLFFHQLCLADFLSFLSCLFKSCKYSFCFVDSRSSRFDMELTLLVAFSISISEKGSFD